MVHSSIGLAGHYERFVEGFPSTAPLTRLTRKDVPLRWSAKCEASFLRLKALSASAPVYCDSSGIVVGMCLTQQGHGIAYGSRQQEGH